MGINITLLIQIVNFLIAYWVLERVFLSLGIREVRARDDALRRRQEELDSSKNLVEGLRFDIRQRWDRYRRSLQQKIPAQLIEKQERVERPKDYAGEVQLHPSRFEQEELIQNLKAAIIKRVS